MTINDTIREKLSDALREAQREALNGGRLFYSAWYDTDGEAGVDAFVNEGDYLAFPLEPGYERYYVHTFDYRYFDILDDWAWEYDEHLRDSFRQKWGADFTWPVDEDGDELYGSNPEIAAAAAKTLGKSDDEIDAWIAEERESAINEYVANLDTDLIIDDYLSEF